MPPLKKTVALEKPPMVPVEDEESQISVVETPRKEGLPPVHPVAAWKPQLGLTLTQVAFVVGSVYLKGRIQSVDTERGEEFHPIVYAFLREVVAGPLLFLIAWLSVGVHWPKRPDLMRIAGLGVCLFLSQLFYITGIELSGVVVATCMQPVIPVFTATMGILLKMEHAHPQKLVGIGMAVIGAISMVSGGITQQHKHSGGGGGSQVAAAAAGRHMLMGNLCLLINTMAMAAYYIFAKQVVQRYPVVLVAAWAYLTAAACMGASAAVFTNAADWHFPRALYGPLVYWIIICSVAGYFIVTWATRHLPASQVASFQCLQPFIGTLLAFGVLGETPTWWDLGAFGVVAGLLLIVKDSRDLEPAITRLKRLMSTHSMGTLLTTFGGGGGTANGYDKP